MTAQIAVDHETDLVEGNMRRIIRPLFAVLAAIFLSWGITAMAASHREAPQIANDPTADLTDVVLLPQLGGPD